MAARITATDEALDAIERLTAKHGPLMLYQSGGCCDGSAPLCLHAGERVGLLARGAGGDPLHHAGARTLDSRRASEPRRHPMLFGQEHVDRYRATDGEEGYDWQKGTTILLLTTKGRKSGAERTTPLIFQPDGDDYLIVASRGGTDQPPGWYLNLQAEPVVEVQVKGDVFKARARDATPEEKPEMWAKMAAAWPDYDEYQKKTDRVIPVVVLERV